MEVGGNRYTAAVQDGLHVEWAEAEQLKRIAVQEQRGQVQRILTDVTRTSLDELAKLHGFILAGNANLKIARILVSGGASQTLGLRDAISRRFQVPVDDFPGVPSGGKRLLLRGPEYAVAVGCAWLSLQGSAGLIS